MNAFDKVIGYDDLKMELLRLADSLKNIEKYKRLGVHTPKGLLISGNAGLGKTLMASCLIEESGRTAFVLRKNKPDGEFVTKIKDVFDRAVQSAPSIVFLDDLDRFANGDDKHKNGEEYVTVQACIDEVKDEEVFVVATANVLDNLPESLLRKGRFDVAITVYPPDYKDAVNIVEYYLSKKENVGDIDAEEIAGILDGASCAALETVINHAGLYAGYEGKEKIEQGHLIQACLTILYDAPEAIDMERKKHIREIAVHEAGHALVAEMNEPGSVSLVSVCRGCGNIGGITVTKQEDRYENEKSMKSKIEKALGGKAATEIVYSTADLGIDGDITYAFILAEKLVDDFCLKGYDKHITMQPSEDLFSRKDTAVAKEVLYRSNSAKKLIETNREFFDCLVEELVKRYTLTAKDIKAIRQAVGV